MAVASSSSSSSAMNKSSEEESKNKEDEHEYDVVMPGFRFHPTEEELVEFYLRRKVEGKHFNVELITFLDLYRYDPWELPGLAAIGEKEWYFYVPRDRKYRNGDRPNRVTTSGYWKATGADRMIRTENQRSIGLKKTLVFYSGKAPKGIRTSWIMNEYRLPLHETQRLQKAEISLCRVYKRAGVEDYPSLPSSRISKPISQNQASMERFQSTTINDPKSITDQITSTSSTSNPSQPLPLSNHDSFNIIDNPLIIPPNTSIFATTSSSHALDDLHNLVNNINYSQVQQVVHHDHQNPRNNNPINLVSSHFSTSLQPQTQPAGALSPFQAAFSDRLWDWNVISDQAGKDLTNLFK